MQTMEMGSAEAALTQLSTMPTGSSSYFLQLDPSGHIDILESSLVLNKPDMVDETVYEIQLDQYVMDERNVEVINLQNLQNVGAFQSEYLEEQHFTTSVEPQYQFQIEDINLDQMLMNSATDTSVVSMEEETVPDFTVETEVATESAVVQVPPTSLNLFGNVTISGFGNTQTQAGAVQFAIPAMQDNQRVEGQGHTISDPTHRSEEILSGGSVSEINKEEVTKEEKEEAKSEKLISGSKEESAESKKVKKEPIEEPDNVGFTEEVMPPVVEMYPSENKTIHPPIVTIFDDDKVSTEVGKSPLKPKLLYENMDPDDELYISYHSRPDPCKTAMCVLCYDWFETSLDLDNHLKSVHRDNMKLYGCKKCDKKFWSRFLRQRHEKLHRYDLRKPLDRYLPKNRPFDHYETNHFYKRLRPAPLTDRYREHLKLIHSQIKSTEYDCIQCGKDFRTEEECREHYDEEHALQTCTRCEKVVGSAKLLRDHEQEVHGHYAVQKNYPGGAWKLWESWDCDELKERDERLVNLSLFHNYNKRKKHDEQPDKDSTASNCDMFMRLDCEEVTINDYEAANALERRKSTEKSLISPKSGDKRDLLQPPDIPKPRKTDLKASSSKFQDYDKIVFLGMTPSPDATLKREDLPFKCDQCRTSFDNDTDLQRHIKSHAVRAMAYMCQYCGRGFATHSNRKEHERIHTGDKPYVCPICSRAFVQISNLKKHIQTHKDKNNLQCSTCNKQFVKESSLILHQRAHSQDRKFRCHICDRAYNYASLLKRHMRIHTGENPYSCEDCGQQFHELVSLHYHRKKVHTGERPHRCDSCGRAFILSSDLKKHLKIHMRDGNSINPRSTGGSPSKSSKANSANSPKGKASVTAEIGAISKLSPSVINFNNKLDTVAENQNTEMTSESDVNSQMQNDQDDGISDEERLVINETDLAPTAVGNDEAKNNNVAPHQPMNDSTNSTLPSEMDTTSAS